MSKGDDMVGLGADERIKLKDSAQNFRRAEIAGDTAAMQLELDSKAAVELRRKRDMGEAYDDSLSRQKEYAEHHGGKRPPDYPLLFATYVYAQAIHFAREMELYRKLTDRKIKNLEDRLAVHEQSVSLRYKGVWKQGVTAEAGTFWTFQGALWACLGSTTERPGHSKNFQLAVKRAPS